MPNDVIPYFEDPQSKLRPGEPIVERDTVNVIIYDRKTNQVLCLDWGKFDWKTFVVGGIEKGEDLVAASKREVEEETGYLHITYITEVGKTRSGFYAKHKNENRIANATGMLFELIDNEQIPVSEKELATHTFHWIPKNEVESFLNLSSQKHLWQNTLKTLDK